MTVRTFGYLTGTEFAPGQPTGSITPQDVIDLVDTLQYYAQNIPITTRSGTGAAALTDVGCCVEITSASANNFTIPPVATVAFQVNNYMQITQAGAGISTIVAGAGVTINTPGTLILRTQWSTVQLRMRASNVWLLSGDTT